MRRAPVPRRAHALARSLARSLTPARVSPPPLRAVADGEVSVQLSFELGWMLYALARCHADRPTQAAYHSSYHLLAAVIHLLLAHLPEEAMTSGCFWPKLESSISFPSYPFPKEAQDVLFAHLKLDEQRELVAKQQPTVAVLLKELGALFALPLTADGALSSEGSFELRALLAPSKLADTVAVVKAHYDKLWGKRAQLDDRYFLLQQAIRYLLALP